MLIIIIAPCLLEGGWIYQFLNNEGNEAWEELLLYESEGFFSPKDITHLPFLYSYVILLHLWHLKYYRNASESLPLIFFFFWAIQPYYDTVSS